MYLVGQSPHRGDDPPGHHHTENQGRGDTQEKAGNDNASQSALLSLGVCAFLDEIEWRLLLLLLYHHMEGTAFQFHLAESWFQIPQVVWEVLCAAVELGPQVEMWKLPMPVVDQNAPEFPVEFGCDQVFLDHVDRGHDAEAEEATHHGRQQHERNDDPVRQRGFIFHDRLLSGCSRCHALCAAGGS